MSNRFSGFRSRGRLAFKCFAVVALLVAAQGMQCPIQPPPADLCEGVTCPAGEQCDPDTGECVAVDLCANVTCPTGEECDPATGQCVAVDLCEGVTCPTGETCNPNTGQCEAPPPPPPPALTVTASADNATPQVGATVNLLATVSGGSPPFTFQWTQTAGPAGAALTNANQQTAQATFSAEGTFTFNVFVADSEGEAAQGSVDVTASGGATALQFTANVDTLTGTSGDDTFSAPSTVTANGATINTLQTGDSGSGLEGADTLNITLAGNFTANNTIVPTLSGIETLNISDFTSDTGGPFTQTINGTNVTGVTTINSVGSAGTAAAADALVVNNLATLVSSIGVTNSIQDFTVAFQAAATSSASDEVTVTLSDSSPGADPNDGATITITEGGANGIETLTIDSTGSANRIDDIAVAQTTLTRVNITGSATLAIDNALDNNVVTVDASGFSGTLEEVTVGNGNVAFTGGSGDDTVIYGGNYSTADAIDGGAGTNTLGINAAQAAVTAAQSNVTNIQGLRFMDALNTNVDVQFWGTIASVAMDGNNVGVGGLNGGTLTLLSGSSSLTVGNASNLGVQIDSAGGTVTVAGTSTGDSLDITLNDADFTALVTVNGAETVSITSNVNLDGSAADGAANTFEGNLTFAPTFGTGTLTVTGTEDLAIGDAVGDTVTIGGIDASGFTQALIMLAQPQVAIQITGGSGNDQLRGSNNNDILSGGDGNDTLVGEQGADLLTLGTGIDTVEIRVANADGADRVTVSDFDDTANSGDVINVDADDLATLDGTDNFASSASLQAHSAAGNLTVAAATEVVRVTSGTVANFTDANSLNGTNLLTAIGGTITTNAADNEILFLVADTSGNVGVYFGDSGGADTGIVAAELTLVAILQGDDVTLANMVFNNFSNDNGI